MATHIDRFGGSLVLLTLLVGAVSPGAAQCCRPSFGADEVIAGGAGNAVLRGPWLTAPWRRPVPRAAVFTLGSFVYERFVDHGGWSWSDFNQRLVSYALTEAVVGGVQLLRRKAVRRRAAQAALILAANRDTCSPGLAIPLQRPPPPRQPPSLAGVSRLCGLQWRW